MMKKANGRGARDERPASQPRLRVLNHVKKKYSDGREFTASQVAGALKLTPVDVGHIFAMNNPEKVKKAGGNSVRAMWVYVGVA